MRFGWHIVLTKDAQGRVSDPDKFRDLLTSYANRVVGPIDTVELLFTSSRTLSTQSLLSTVNTISLVHDVLMAEAAGMDGVMLAASIDPAVEESRSVANIPVVGSIESALALCGFIGGKAGIVTIAGGDDEHAYARKIEFNATKYGCRDKLIANRPVRALRHSWKEFYVAYSRAISGDGDEFVSLFDETARDLVKDGADVIICGNQLFGAVLDHFGRLTCTSNNVPILDNAAAGLKTLQTLASLRASVGLNVSRTGVFRSPAIDPPGNAMKLLSTLADGIVRSMP